ncbi:MAG: hypothetical protein IJB32_03800 [Clostridia bacterium]|nr:hypothetical protein [Clostridia bacterium]
MNENYAKTMLYAYPYIDSMVKRLDEKIMNKALGSMFDVSPSEEQCAKVLVLMGKKDDLKYLKHLIELMMMKFPFSDFDYFDYKYFRIRPKKDYEEKIKLNRAYYRKQEKLIKKYCLIFSAIGGDDKWFEDKFLSIGFIKNLYIKVLEHEKAHAKRRKDNKD